MRKPLPEKYPKGLADLVAKLTPLEKAELYAHGRAPDGLSPEQTKELLGNIDKIWGESDAYPNYEGRTGASPREIKTLLLNAAQNAEVRVRLAAGGLRGDGGAGQERHRLRVLEAGAAAGRLPREQEVHRHRARASSSTSSTTRCARRWGWSRSGSTRTSSGAT